MILPQLKKFGHYKVNNFEYYTLSDAKAASKIAGKPFSYHFNEEIYDQYDWTKDPCPDLTLDDMYRLRAQQLRDEYDYVVIMYSGGPDSANVLDAFCHNGIHVDEIINFNSYSSTSVVDGTLNNADYVYNVKPTIEQYQRKGKLRAKITIYDEVEYSKKHWSRVKSLGWDDVATDLGGPSMWLNSGHAHQYNKDLWDKIQSGVKVCIINGHDKPNSVIYNGKRAIFHSDVPAGNFKEVVKQYDTLMAPVIKTWNWFYASQDTAPIVIKQCYVLNQFCNSHPEPEFYSPPPKDKNLRPSHNWPSKHGYGNLKYDIFHSLIYPRWQPGFVTPKPRNLLLRPQDCWWVNDLPTDQKTVWIHHVQKFFRENYEVLKTGAMTAALPRTAPRLVE
jgi:hypothetical protein